MSAVLSNIRMTVLLAAALAPLSPALAGSAGPTPAAPAPATAGEAKADPVCASYGAGFARLSGSSTCVKISGNMQMDGYNQSYSGGGNPSALQPALRSQ
jgi:hypothetical protein